MRPRNRSTEGIKTGAPLSGSSMAETGLRAMRSPRYRWRDHNLGSDIELENLFGGAKGKGTIGSPARPKVLIRGEEADCPAVAVKRGNPRGAKGTGHSRNDRLDQLGIVRADWFWPRAAKRLNGTSRVTETVTHGSVSGLRCNSAGRLAANQKWCHYRDQYFRQELPAGFFEEYAKGRTATAVKETNMPRYDFRHIRSRYFEFTIQCSRCGHRWPDSCFDQQDSKYPDDPGGRRYIDFLNDEVCCRLHCRLGCSDPEPILLFGRFFVWLFTQKPIRGYGKILVSTKFYDNTQVIPPGLDAEEEIQMLVEAMESANRITASTYKTQDPTQHAARTMQLDRTDRR